MLTIPYLTCPCVHLTLAFVFQLQRQALPAHEKRPPRRASLTSPITRCDLGINEFSDVISIPIMPGLLRRRGPTSDADIRRHSFYLVENASNSTTPDGRASEQIPRRPSATEFLSPSTAVTGPSRTGSSTEIGTEFEQNRSVSPPIQDETPKHRRFSMLKFRHASDSQLSMRARLQAQKAAPPIPHRKSRSYPSNNLEAYKINQPLKSSQLLPPWIRMVQ